MKNQILDFVGFDPVSFEMFSPIIASTEEERASWLDDANKLGRQDAVVEQKELVSA
ncbi:hypothetical protein [Pseudovibrio sp. Tun.PSC04-5.I4]|uniref:hypothetical protein n=1 Tax=Pseudovibrio sp. Tun.PSC04-5.I4 TaxID=1798213 RepID=UPI001AD94EC9|nr:hypothetical protein [Pseudovibrio sp. Tun.PSC04-5.I4]